MIKLMQRVSVKIKALKFRIAPVPLKIFLRPVPAKEICWGPLHCHETLDLLNEMEPLQASQIVSYRCLLTWATSQPQRSGHLAIAWQRSCAAPSWTKDEASQLQNALQLWPLSVSNCSYAISTWKTLHKKLKGNTLKHMETLELSKSVKSLKVPIWPRPLRASNVLHVAFRHFAQQVGHSFAEGWP